MKFLYFACFFLTVSSAIGKSVEIVKFHNAILKDQENNQQKGLITDLLIDNVLGLCYVSCPNGGKKKKTRN